MVYVIVVYDVKSENNREVRTFLRMYLNHTQNSVFEGEVSEGKFKEIKSKIDSEVGDDEKSIIFKLYSENVFERFSFGENESLDDSNII